MVGAYPHSLGNLSNEHAIALADFLQSFGSDVIRATIDQNLTLRNIPEAFLGNVFEIVRKITPLASAARVIGTAVACTGASHASWGYVCRAAL